MIVEKSFVLFLSGVSCLFMYALGVVGYSNTLREKIETIVGTGTIATWEMMPWWLKRFITNVMPWWLKRFIANVTK